MQRIAIGLVAGILLWVGDLACGNQDLFVADNRRFVERLTARKIPYEYHELSPFGHSWDLWDPQIVNFMDVISKLWSQSGR